MARLHEWDGSDMGDFLISRFRIAACAKKHEHVAETRRVRSKYSVTTGPSRCVLDIGFSPWFSDGWVRVRLEAPNRTVGPCIWLILRSNNTVQISFRSFFVLWDQPPSNADKKIRIVLTLTKENEVQFEYDDSESGSLQLLGKTENQFDACYPAVSICNGSSATVTWVDE